MEQEQEKKNFFASKTFIIGISILAVFSLLIFLTVKKWFPAWAWWVIGILGLAGLIIFIIFKYVLHKPIEEIVNEFSEKHIPEDTDKQCSDYLKNKIMKNYGKELDFENPIEENIIPVGEEGKSSVIYWAYVDDYHNGDTFGVACKADNKGMWKMEIMQFGEEFQKFKERFEKTLRSLAESFRPLEVETTREYFDDLLGKPVRETTKKAPEIIIQKPQEQPAFGGE